MRSGKREWIMRALTLLVAACQAPAQGPTYGLGRLATEEEIRAWDISVGPEGRELPPGQGTPQQGAEIYARKCAYCHGPTGEEPFMWWSRREPYQPEDYCCFPAPLVGHQESLTTLIPVKSVGAYWAYATTLWDYINRAMPPTEYAKSVRGYEFAEAVRAEGPLTPDEVYALTAFILHRNGIIGENTVLNAETLPRIRMPARDRFLPRDPGRWWPRRQVDPHISPRKRSEP